MKNIAIKGKLVDFETKNFGLFLIFLNTITKSVEINAIYGKSGFIGFYDISASTHDVILTSMTELLDRGEANVEQSRKLIDALRQNDDLYFKLFEKDNFKQRLEVALNSRLKSFFLSKTLKIVLDLDQIADIRYTDILQQAIDHEKDEETLIIRKEYSIHFAIDVIHCNPIYSPSSGNLAVEFAKGDLIACTPSPEYLKNIEIIEKHALLDERGELKRFAAVVDQIKKSGEEFTIIANLTDNLVGFLVIRDGVKVEKIDPKELENSRLEEEKNSENQHLETHNLDHQDGLNLQEKIREFIKNNPSILFSTLFLLLVGMFFILYYFLS